MNRKHSLKLTLLSFGLISNLQTANAQTDLSTVSGTWYDPAYSGSGFNMAEFSNGLFAYFYGYKGNKDGEAQWLLTASGIPTPIEKGKTYTVNMVAGFAGNGGSFTSKPNPPQSGTKDWGTMKLTFDSCNSGYAVLNGKDGKITHNIVKLAGLTGLSCSEVKKTTTPTTTSTTPLKKMGIFTVMDDQTTVVMNGTIKTRSLNDFKQLIQQYPNIKTINIKNCDGSIDDTANLKMSKIVYDKGINIHVMDNGEIASGGVDFFVAGKQRTLGKNTKVGVHSWGGDGDTATDYPRGHAYHQPYIAYYKSVGFSQQQAEDFYYFTIYAASAEDIHWMTAAELKKYNVTTS